MENPSDQSDPAGSSSDKHDTAVPEKKRRHYNQWVRSDAPKPPKQTAFNWRSASASGSASGDTTPMDLMGESSDSSSSQHQDSVSVSFQRSVSNVSSTNSTDLVGEEPQSEVEACEEDRDASIHGDADEPVQLEDTDENDDHDHLDREMAGFVDLEELGQEEEGEDDGDNERADYHDNHARSSNADKLIYSGARITLATSVLLKITFVIRHGLSGAALVDLLSLVEIHCLSDNICQTSLRLFRRYFEDIKTPIEKHFCCISCEQYLGTDTQSCPKCKKEGHHFITTPLASVLQSFFAREYHFYLILFLFFAQKGT